MPHDDEVTDAELDEFWRCANFQASHDPSGSASAFTYREVIRLIAALRRERELLKHHRRYHGAVGCPGGRECYVCRAEDTAELPEPPQPRAT